MSEEKEKYVVTKRSYEIKDGQKHLKEITEELKPSSKNTLALRDYIDLSFKLIGLVAIALPVLLFYLQSKVERKRRLAQYKFDLYAEASAELNLTASQKLGTQDFARNYSKLYHENIPKIRLLGDKLLNAKFDTLKYMQDAILYLTETYNHQAEFKNQLNRNSGMGVRHARDSLEEVYDKINDDMSNLYSAIISVKEGNAAMLDKLFSVPYVINDTLDYYSYCRGRVGDIMKDENSFDANLFLGYMIVTPLADLSADFVPSINLHQPTQGSYQEFEYYFPNLTLSKNRILPQLNKFMNQKYQEMEVELNRRLSVAE